MMRLSQAAQALGVPFAGRDVEFNAVSTDSRAVRPACSARNAPQVWVR